MERNSWIFKVLVLEIINRTVPVLEKVNYQRLVVITQRLRQALMFEIGREPKYMNLKNNVLFFLNKKAFIEQETLDKKTEALKMTFNTWLPSDTTQLNSLKIYNLVSDLMDRIELSMELEEKVNCYAVEELSEKIVEWDSFIEEVFSQTDNFIFQWSVRMEKLLQKISRNTNRFEGVQNERIKMKIDKHFRQNKNQRTEVYIRLIEEQIEKSVHYFFNGFQENQIELLQNYLRDLMHSYSNELSKTVIEIHAHLNHTFELKAEGCYPEHFLEDDCDFSFDLSGIEPFKINPSKPVCLFPRSVNNYLNSYMLRKKVKKVLGSSCKCLKDSADMRLKEVFKLIQAKFFGELDDLVAGIQEVPQKALSMKLSDGTEDKRINEQYIQKISGLKIELRKAWEEYSESVS
ncbi:MAG: hypothetical protein HPY50_02090 [Firmicutes bacterium]|nr:hypothetical protein [Bacillota bacterium]